MAKLASLLAFAATATAAALGGSACGGRIEATDGERTSETTFPGATSPQPPSRAPAPPPTGKPAPAPPASELFVPDDQYCVRASRENASTALRPRDSSDQIAVVSVSVAEECTGAGGTYLLARDLEAPENKYWLGGHACQSSKLLSGLTSTFGVARYTNTSSVLTIPAHACVSFPGEGSGQESVTPTKIRAVALFETQAEAEAFAAAVRR